MEITKIIQLQREFDENHQSSFEWAQPITADNKHTLLHLCVALAGEVGELANLVKKYDRGDFEFDNLSRLLPGEIADVFIYLIKLCYQADIDLEQAFLDKLEWNLERFRLSEKKHDSFTN